MYFATVHINCAKAQGGVRKVVIAGTLLWKPKHMHSVECSLQHMIAWAQEEAVRHLETGAFWHEPTSVQRLKL